MNTKRLLGNILPLLLLFFSATLLKAQVPQQEVLDRGLVAVKTSKGVFVSWRFLGTDVRKTSFDLYRDGVKVNTQPISTVTNFEDTNGAADSKYTVKTLLDGQVVETSKEASVWAQFYQRIEVKRPTGGTTPDGVTYTYSPNDCSVGDVDGDGEYEIILKWDPSNQKDNSESGYTGNVYLDCYKLDGTFKWRIDLGRNIRAGAHYTQMMVYDLDGDGKAELACKTAPGTIDGAGKAVLMGSDSATADYRNSKGYILSGSEYLTVFNGETGAQITTIAYEPARGTVSSWGDSYGNRVDRFLACIAYLDGMKPSLVMCRGYYTRAVLVAYDFDGKTLKRRWIHDSPTKGKDAYGEGNHNLSVGDVDGDGCDEIIYGACTIDHDGTLLYRTGWGHGDAIHFGDLDPDVEGLEVFMPHEEKSSAYGFEMHMAGTGKLIFGTKTGSDVGRGLSADIDAAHRGSESWSTANGNIYDCKGNIISTSGRPSVNFRLYWDGDLQDEMLDGASLSKWNGQTQKTTTFLNLANYHNASSCNSTKKTPCLSADILGDWREEVILWDGNTSSHLLIFTTVTPTTYRVPTLMHDHVYRMGVAWQNVAYNQPPHLGYFLADLGDTSTRLINKGTGDLTQKTEVGRSISPISYAWVNATDINVAGLPDGVSITKDIDEQRFIISGSPTAVGEYPYTIRSEGGPNEVVLQGTIRVKERAVLTTIAYFAFDETEGNNAANQVYGSASAVGFTPEWVSGVKGNALNLPALPADRRMVQPHYSDLSLGKDDFTIELWFRSSGGSGVDWYLLHGGSHAKNATTGATGKWVGLQYKNNNLTFGIDDDVNKSNVDVPASDYFNGKWTHVVCVRDTDEEKIKLYINGNLAGEKADATGNISQTEDWVLGNCNVNFNTPFVGAIDELTFYKGAMHAEVVKENFEANKQVSVEASAERAPFARVYPICFENQVSIDFSCARSEMVNIAISSVSGQMVYQNTYRIDGHEKLTISGLEGLADGVYTIVVESPEERMAQKIVKM